jgi:hypothetical protein
MVPTNSVWNIFVLEIENMAAESNFKVMSHNLNAMGI